MDNDSRHSLNKIIHELTQPLTTVRAYGFVAVNQLDSDVADAKAVADSVRKMVEAADFASELLIRFSSIELADSLHRDNVDLSELIRKPCELIEPNLRYFGIDLQLSEIPDCQVNVDAVQIQAALINLFRNSIESRNERDSEPVIKVEASVVDDWVEVAVSDNGRGVPREMHEDLFQKSNSSISGRGIGLPICREIIELHGGKIGHKDNNPAGAKFHFTLPLTTDEKPANEHQASGSLRHVKADMVRQLKGDIKF